MRIMTRGKKPNPRGATHVWVVDVVERRLTLAKALGATVVNAREEDVVQALRRYTGGGPDVVIEATGAPAAIATAFRSAARGATVVAAGVTSILNFAPIVLNVPEGVDVRKVDLSIELQILAFHAQRRSVVRVLHRPDHEVRSIDGHRRAVLDGDGPVAAEAVGT